jgi:CubicO group peptidase (beta-lactamase class C family)
MPPACPTLRRFAFLLTGAALAAAGGVRAQDPAAGLSAAIGAAAQVSRLQCLIVARAGVPLIERAFRGPGLDRAVNVKSVSKSVIAALVGIALDRRLLAGLDQPVAPLLRDKLPQDPDPRFGRLTLEHLLSMQAGLERTSGPFYGRWIASPDWVRFVLARPFVDEPGGRMLYSTGNSHLLSAILTRLTGRSTLDLAREWLGKPLGVEIPAWERDPQGIYLGGNNMALSPRAMLRFGEMFRLGGLHGDRRILSQAWVDASWAPRERSPFTGHAYGLGWFITTAGGHPVYYAFGFGGQMIYVVPGLAVTAVMTSDLSGAANGDGYVQRLHGLVADDILPAVERLGSS